MWSATVSLRMLAPAVLLTGAGLAVSAGTPTRERTLRGEVRQMGAGMVQSFVRIDSQGSPLAVGVNLSSGALEQLPSTPNTVSRCFDMDGDGRHTGHECIGDLERVLDVPVGPDAKLPFRWITVNWNAAGHPAPYNRPHFDIHFYTVDRARIEAITPGRCGELVDCGHFKRATQPVPERYHPSGHINVGAVVPRMGNHLLDSESPEIRDSMPFTRTFIYGAYEGELIFWEPMITHEFLLSSGDECFGVRQPRAFRQAGYYPTKYCVRRNNDGGRTVSLEGFRYAERS